MMNNLRTFQVKKVLPIITIVIVASLIISCIGPALQCYVTSAKNYGFEIRGEAGKATIRKNDRPFMSFDSGGKVAEGVDVNQELVYAESKNTYQITGKIMWDNSNANNPASYDIKATGGVFGDTPQTCKK